MRSVEFQRESAQGRSTGGGRVLADLVDADGTLPAIQPGVLFELRVLAAPWDPGPGGPGPSTGPLQAAVIAAKRRSRETTAVPDGHR